MNQMILKVMEAVQLMNNFIGENATGGQTWYLVLRTDAENWEVQYLGLGILEKDDIDDDYPVTGIYEELKSRMIDAMEDVNSFLQQLKFDKVKAEVDDYNERHTPKAGEVLDANDD